jgi:hypothetical protein
LKLLVNVTATLQNQVRNEYNKTAILPIADKTKVPKDDVQDSSSTVASFNSELTRAWNRMQEEVRVLAAWWRCVGKINAFRMSLCCVSSVDRLFIYCFAADVFFTCRVQTSV